jgi:TonB family protein
MVRVYMITFLFLLAHIVNGQNIDSTEIYMITFVEEAPLFKGDLKKFIQNELVYPLSAKKDNLEGTIVISFKIDTLGLTTNHKVVKGIREDLNNEALRVAKLIKFERPALQKGIPLEVEYNIPIKFDLQHIHKKSKCRE